MVRQAANRAIVELISSKDFKQCIEKIKPEYLQKDLTSEVCLALLETAPEKIVCLHQKKELKFYAVRIIFNMACSVTSPFYKKFKGFDSVSYNDNYNTDYYEHYSYDNESEKGLNGQSAYSNHINLDSLFDESEIKDRKKLELLAFDLINTLYWYDAEILRLYLVHGDYRTVSKETRIPFTSVYMTIQKAIKEIKAKLAVSEIPTNADISKMLEKLQTIISIVA